MKALGTLAVVACVLAFGYGCGAGGGGRTTGWPTQIHINDCTKTAVFIDLKGGDQRGDMPKTFPIAPSLGAAASQSGDASATASPVVATDAGVGAKTETQTKTEAAKVITTEADAPATTAASTGPLTAVEPAKIVPAPTK